MLSQARNRSPDGSFQGMPVACTFVPGAWPMISSRAVAEIRNTGRGPNGKCAAQTAQARASAARSSGDDATVTQFGDDLIRQCLG